MEEYALDSLGLFPKENVVYRAILELGMGTAGSLIKRTGLSRSTVYTVLSKLVNLGLVSMDAQETTTYFIVQDPRRIADYYDQQKKQLNQKKEAALEVAEKLLPLYKQRGTVIPKIKFYYGQRGILKMIEENVEPWHESIYRQQGEHIWWAYRKQNIGSSWLPFLLKQSEKYRKGKDLQVLVLAKEKGSDDQGGSKYAKARYLPKGCEVEKGNLWVMGDFVVMFYEEGSSPFALMVHDEALAHMQRSMLKLLWDGAGEE